MNILEQYMVDSGSFPEVPGVSICGVDYITTPSTAPSIKVRDTHMYSLTIDNLPMTVAGCGVSATTTLMTSWSSLAAATAESSCPIWSLSPQSPLATWWTMMTSVTQRSTTLRSKGHSCE